MATWIVGGAAATADVIVTSPTRPPPTMNSHGNSVATSMCRQSMWRRRTRGSWAGRGSGSATAPSPRSAVAPSHCGSAIARAAWNSASSCSKTLAASWVAKPSCGSGYAMLKKTARAPAATFSALAMAGHDGSGASVRLGELAPDAPLERGDVEVRSRVDDAARAGDRLLDDETAALEAALDERGQRRLDVVAVILREHLVEDHRVLEHDRRAGGERRRPGTGRTSHAERCRGGTGRRPAGGP